MHLEIAIIIMFLLIVNYDYNDCRYSICFIMIVLLTNFKQGDLILDKEDGEVFIILKNRFHVSKRAYRVIRFIQPGSDVYYSLPEITSYYLEDDLNRWIVLCET